MTKAVTPTKALLLVEDEALIRHDLEEGLEEAGFDVMDMAQGETALSKLEADPSRFIGLITDITLGKGPDGWEVARRARELVPNLPVVYISGHGSGDWPSRGVPNSLILSKPFASAQLITAISTLLVEADAHKAREG
jgi:DNA-binding response OmpR family regulator